MESRTRSRSGAAALCRALAGGAMALAVLGAIVARPLAGRVSAAGGSPGWGPCFPVMLTVGGAATGDPQQPGPVSSPSCPRMDHGSGGGDVYVPLNPTPVTPPHP